MNSGISQVSGGVTPCSEAPTSQDISIRPAGQQTAAVPATVVSTPISRSTTAPSITSSNNNSIPITTIVTSSNVLPQTTTPIQPQSSVTPQATMPPSQQTLPPVSTLVSASLRPIAPAMTIPSTPAAFPRSSVSNVKSNNVCPTPVIQKSRIAPIPVQPRPPAPVRPQQSSQFQHHIHQLPVSHQHSHQHQVPIVHQHPPIHPHSHAQIATPPPPQPSTPVQQIQISSQPPPITMPVQQLQINSQPSTPAQMPQLQTPVQLSQPSTPIQLSQPSTPIQLSQPSTPIQLSQPSTPIQLSQPSTPIQQSQPHAPVQLSQPSTPIQLTQPPTPIQLTQPSTPIQQSQPQTPIQLSQPQAPVQLSQSQSQPPVQQIQVNSQPSTAAQQPQYTTLKPMALPRSIAPAPSATPVSVQPVLGSQHSYIPSSPAYSMFPTGTISQPATLQLTLPTHSSVREFESTTFDATKVSTPSVSGSSVGHVCHCSKVKVGTCEPLTHSVNVNAGSTTTVSSSSSITTASIKPQIQPRVVSQPTQPVAPVLPSVNASVSSPYMSPVFSSSTQQPMMVNMMSVPQQPFMGHSGILLHSMMPVQSFVTASQPPQQQPQAHHHPQPSTSTAHTTQQSPSHQVLHQHSSASSTSSVSSNGALGNGLASNNNSSGHRTVMPKPSVSSPMKVGSRPLAPAPTRAPDHPVRPLMSPTKMRAIMPSTTVASASSSAHLSSTTSGGSSGGGGGLFGLKRGDAGRVLNFLSVKKKQALALINKTNSSQSPHGSSLPPAIAPSPGMPSSVPVPHAAVHTGSPVLAGIPMKRKRGRPPKNRPPMMIPSFSSSPSTGIVRQHNTAPQQPQCSAPPLTPQPPPHPPSGTPTPVGQVVGSPRMPVLTASPSHPPPVSTAAVSPMPSAVPSPAKEEECEKKETTMSLTPLSIVTSAREEDEAEAEDEDEEEDARTNSPSPALTPVLPLDVGTKRKTGVVRPEPRNILTHIIDGQVIYESDKPFPVKHAMDVILDTFGPPPAKLAKLQDDSSVSATAFMRCEFCGEMKPSDEFKASRRFCSVSCARKSSVACKVTKKQSVKSEGVASVEPIPTTPVSSSIPSSLPLTPAPICSASLVTSTPSLTVPTTPLPVTLPSSTPSSSITTSTSTSTSTSASVSTSSSITTTSQLPITSPSVLPTVPSLTSSTPASKAVPASVRSFPISSVSTANSLSVTSSASTSTPPPPIIPSAPSRPIASSVPSLPMSSVHSSTSTSSSFTTSITVSAPRPNLTAPFSRPTPTSIGPSSLPKPAQPIPHSTPLSAATPRPKATSLPSALVLSDMADATVLTARLGPMLNWSVEHVFEFVRSTAGCSAYAEAFRSNEIDGEALLLLKEEHLMQAPISMKLGPALKLSARIEEHRV